MSQKIEADDFIENASHELKTPISIIQGLSELLMDYPSASVEIKKIASKILKNSKRLSSVVQNILLLADLGHFYERKFTKIDVDSLITEMISLYSERISIKYKPQSKKTYILGEHFLIEQVFSNLFDNAIKYSKGVNEVTIRTVSSNNEVKIFLIDKGIGIPAENLPYIFNRFYSADKTVSRRMGGSGLGLSIVKKIMELHLGKIEVFSKVDVGSSFTLTFPWYLKEKDKVS